MIIVLNPDATGFAELMERLRGSVQATDLIHAG